jgi:hypothetical protein
MSTFSNDTAADILGYGLEAVPWEETGKQPWRVPAGWVRFHVRYRR